MSAHRTWGGRFQGTLADAMLRLSASVDVDRALAEDDIRGSIAHARGLERANVLTADELARIVRGLETIGEEVRADKMKWDPALEDVAASLGHGRLSRFARVAIPAAFRRVHECSARRDCRW